MHSSSQIHLQDMQSQIQNFDPTSSTNDDFLEQMLSNIPSCSWTDLKSSWDLNPTPNLAINDITPTRDLSDETTPSVPDNMGGFHGFDDSALLAAKMRHHQISGGGDGGPSSNAAIAAAAKLMLQQQLLMAGVHDASSPTAFKSPSSQGGDHGQMQALYNSFAAAGSMQQQFHQPQNFGGPGAVMNQPQTTVSTGGGGGGATSGGAPAQPKQRVRARRGQATDPHSIAERLRRERIAERMKALQELVPNANKTDKASMLDEIIDYVKFLQLQVKVLSMSRLGGAAAVAPLVADISSEGGGDCNQTNTNGGPIGRATNGNKTASSNDSLKVTEHQVAKLMEEDMGSAMQYLQGKGLCLMPISLATAISTATCHNKGSAVGNQRHPLFQSNGEGPSSPNMSILTVQSATMGNGGTDGSVKDAASVSKP